jgi:hypothetical protein
VKVKVELTCFITLEQHDIMTERHVRFEPITVKLSEVEVEVPDELVNVLKVIPNSSLRVRVEGQSIVEAKRQ